MKCANCNKQFDPANRVAPSANEGALAQVRYCTERCARQAENKRYYSKRRKDKRHESDRKTRLPIAR